MSSHNLHIKCSMYPLSALLLDDAPKPATPLTNGAISQTLWQFAPLSDNHLLQLVDWRESSLLIGHLLKNITKHAMDRI